MESFLCKIRQKDNMSIFTTRLLPPQKLIHFFFNFSLFLFLFFFVLYIYIYIIYIYIYISKIRHFFYASYISVLYISPCSVSSFLDSVLSLTSSFFLTKNIFNTKIIILFQACQIQSNFLFLVI